MTHALHTDPDGLDEVHDPVLVARSLVKSHGATPALRGATLAVGRGEILAVTGASGSGKSTLLLCLAGVLTPDAGEVSLDGRTISTEGEATRSALRRSTFGVLFQFGQLVPELTAQENVALPLLLGGVGRRAALTAASSWLERFGVLEQAGVRPSEMSGGQGQRVAVARAMVTEPAVLFADEPTGALDTVSGDRVMAELVRVSREARTTVVVVTHDARVAAHGDREVVLRDGVVATTPVRLAAVGGRADGVRIGLTAVGSALAVLALLAGATVAAIGPGDGPYTSELLNQGGLHVGVVVGLWLLCVPVLVFVGQCSRVGAPARDRRLAALRMAGATPRQVVGIAAAESGLAAGIGAVLALAVHLLARPLLDTPVTGSFARVDDAGSTDVGTALRLPTDVLPAWWVLVVVVVAVPLLVTALAALALRRTALTPFGVLRRRRTSTPRLLPVVLLLVGVVGSFFFGGLQTVGVGGPLLFLVFLLLLLSTLAGLLLGTAATTRSTGLLLAARVRSPALLIAARRMVAQPYAASRAGSAVLVAVLAAAGARMVRSSFLVQRDTNVDSTAFQLVDLALVVALVIAGAGLLVAAAEGLVERRRTLAALVAAGTPRGVLARAALLEAVAPLVLPVLVAAAVGTVITYAVFGTSAERFDTVTQQSVSIPVPVPWAGLAVVVVGSLAAVTAVTAVALAFLRQATDLGELRAAA